MLRSALLQLLHWVGAGNAPKADMMHTGDDGSVHVQSPVCVCVCVCVM